MQDLAKTKFNNWIYTEEFYQDSELIKEIKKDASEAFGFRLQNSASISNFLNFFIKATKSDSVVIIDDLGAISVFSVCENLASEIKDLFITAVYTDGKNYEFTKQELAKHREFQKSVRVIPGQSKDALSRLSDDAYDTVIVCSGVENYKAAQEHSDRLLAHGGNLILLNAFCDDKISNANSRDDDVTGVRSVLKDLEEKKNYVSTFLPLANGIYIAGKK